MQFHKFLQVLWWFQMLLESNTNTQSNQIIPLCIDSSWRYVCHGAMPPLCAMRALFLHYSTTPFPVHYHCQKPM